MENDPLSPHDLRNEDRSERRSEPYLCSEDFSTKNFGRDVLPCSLCKNYDENAYTLAVILNLPETGIAKDAALAPFVGIVKAISYSAIRVMGHIIYFAPVLVLLLMKMKIGIAQIASKGLSRLLGGRRNVRVHESNPNFSANNPSHDEGEEGEDAERASALPQCDLQGRWAVPLPI
jgi:hypothetical protein